MTSGGEAPGLSSRHCSVCTLRTQPEAGDKMADPAASRIVDTHTAVAGEHFAVAVVALPADRRPLLAAAVGRRRGEED